MGIWTYVLCMDIWLFRYMDVLTYELFQCLFYASSSISYFFYSNGDDQKTDKATATKTNEETHEVDAE